MAVYRLLMDISANLLWHIGAPETCQRRAFVFAKLMAPLLKRTFGARRPGYPPYEAKVFNSLITRFSRIRPGLALDAAIDHAELVPAALRHRHGLLIVTIHSELALSCHGLRDAKGRPPVFVGNHQDDMTGWNWGIAEPIEVLDAEDRMVLVQARSAIQAERIIVALVDFSEFYQGPLYISPNAFALASSMQVPVLHMLCTLGPTGRIGIHLAAEPDHLDGPGRKARAFAAFIERQLGVRMEIRRPKDMNVPVNAGRRLPRRGPSRAHLDGNP